MDAFDTNDFKKRDELLDRLLNETKVLGNPALKKAFEDVDRADFVGDDYKIEAYEDYALPIGYGQDIPQPTKAAFMLELLDVKPGQKILDIGSGSGWMTALVAHMTGEEGSVIGVEIIPELVEFGQNNLSSYDFPQASISRAGDTEVGYPEEAPYDRILLSVSVDEIPEGLLDQLKPGGIAVLPIKNEIHAFRKDENGKVREEKKISGFQFQPLR